ncbi:C2H2-type zinc finger protein [Bdellovibrio sp. HCB337]|uniref:C2H2-type zinc finger protein n=1 Tax=Bdellovibrio sp. HCB337 TaxID=3394358 RepID=UPI0039A5C622
MGMNGSIRTKVFSIGFVFTATVIALTFQACGRTPGTWTDLSSNMAGQDSLGSTGGINTPILTGPGGPDYSALDSAIFQPKCAGCHAQFASYTTLMAAKTKVGGSFIVAGNSTASAVHIETNAGRMPMGAPLPADQIAAIRAWIDAGAKPPGTVSGGGGGTVPPPAPTPTPPPIVTGPGGVDYANLENSIFKPKCASCHAQFASYTALMAAKTASGASFIVAGNAATSAVHIETAAGRMPRGVPLAANEVTAIRDWINAGAKPPGSSGVPVTPTPVPTPDLQATWTKLVAPGGVIANNCAGCHSGARPSGDLDLLNYNEARENARAIKSLVNGTGGGEAGDDDASVMPPTGPMIKAYRDTISSWVDRGAPQ